MSNAADTQPIVAAKEADGRFKHRIRVGDHQLIVDEPASFGGDAAGPSPYDLLSAALAACTSMTIRLYGERKRLQLPAFTVEVRHEKIHAKDCLDCIEGLEGKIDRFERRIIFDGHVDAAMEAAILQIADSCPVHQTLESRAAIVTRTNQGR